MSNTQKEIAFNKELALWQRAVESNDSNLTIEYLTIYPSGFFNQLAQARLDLLLAKEGEKRIQIVGSPSNPYSKGSVSGLGNYSIGDTYTYEKTDMISGLIEKRFSETITEITKAHIIFNDGERITDYFGNDLKSPNERILSPTQFHPDEYYLGQKWATRYEVIAFHGLQGGSGGSQVPGKAIHEYEFRVLNREKINVLAGVFNAFRVDGVGHGETARHNTKYWIDPEKCLRPIIFEVFFRRRNGLPYESSRLELVSFKQKNITSDF